MDAGKGGIVEGAFDIVVGGSFVGADGLRDLESTTGCAVMS